MPTHEDYLLISKIADRAIAMYRDRGICLEKTGLFMDLDNVHRILPLRLQELLDADNYEFSHDIGGIYKHFNRRTLKLEGCFVPRFAV